MTHTNFILSAWNDLTRAGYHLQRGDHDLVLITAPTGYISTVRARRLPSLARIATGCS